MCLSTKVMAQLKWEAFASGGSNTVTVASNSAVRIHAIMPGTNASTNTGILVEFGTNAPVFLSGAQTDMEIIVDRYGVGNPTPFSVSSLGSVTPKGVLILPGPLTIRKAAELGPALREGLASPVPFLIQIPVDYSENLSLMKELHTTALN